MASTCMEQSGTSPHTPPKKCRCLQLPPGQHQHYLSLAWEEADGANHLLGDPDTGCFFSSALVSSDVAQMGNPQTVPLRWLLGPQRHTKQMGQNSMGADKRLAPQARLGEGEAPQLSSLPCRGCHASWCASTDGWARAQPGLRDQAVEAPAGPRSPARWHGWKASVAVVG